MKDWIFLFLFACLIIFMMGVVRWGEQTRGELAFGMTVEQVYEMVDKCEKKLPRDRHCKAVVTVEEVK